MKLSTAQKKVIDDATAKIDFARSHNFYDWYRHAYNCATYSDSDIDDHVAKWDCKYPRLAGYHHKNYERYINGEAVVTANTRTLKRLEMIGLIEIVEEGGMYPDWIKVINY